MWIIPLQAEILVLEIEDRPALRVDDHLRQRPRRAGELKLGLFEVVEVEMRVSQRVDELPRLQISHLRHHHREQRI